MKKYLAPLMLAAIILSAGCGNQAQQVVNEAKREAASEVRETVNEVRETANEVEQTVNNITGTAPTANIDAKFSLGGISPGMTFDEVKRILGEPTYVHDEDEFTFANGLMIDLDLPQNIVGEIKSRQTGVATGAGIAIGMTEQNLFAAYGSPAVTDNDDGILEHKYYSGDNRFKIEFDVSNGSIIEIKCSLND